jgi:HAD superfamily hydrolase (TIGR01490 family)
MIYIFDIDNTLFRGSTVRTYMAQAFLKRVLPLRILFPIPRYFFRFLLSGVDERIVNKPVSALKGFSEYAMRSLAEEVFESRIRHALEPNMVKMIEEAKKDRYDILFASSSFGIIIEPIASYFSIDDIIATELEFRSGVSTGIILSLPPYKNGKKERVLSYLKKKRIDPADAVFFSDHHDDLPLLSVVGKAVAVNPTARLARVAQKKGWKIIKSDK